MKLDTRGNYIQLLCRKSIGIIQSRPYYVAFTAAMDQYEIITTKYQSFYLSDHLSGMDKGFYDRYNFS